MAGEWPDGRGVRVGQGVVREHVRWWSSRLGRAPAVSFLELVPPPAAAAAAPEPSRDLVVEVGVGRVRVAPGFDPSLLSAVVRALAEGAQ